MGDHNFQAVQKLGLAENTVVDWYNCLREICSADLTKMDLRIGGPGIIVEMNESNLKKKPKHNVGNAWFFTFYLEHYGRTYIKTKVGINRRDV
jgi:hypothetical protein